MTSWKPMSGDRHCPSAASYVRAAASDICSPSAAVVYQQLVQHAPSLFNSNCHNHSHMLLFAHKCTDSRRWHTCSGHICCARTNGVLLTSANYGGAPQFVPQLVQYAPQERCHGGIHDRCSSVPIHSTAASTVPDTRACRRNNCTRIGSSRDEACDEASDQDALGLGMQEHNIDSALRSMELR